MASVIKVYVVSIIFNQFYIVLILQHTDASASVRRYAELL